MSDKVQIVCKGCEAVLAMPGTADDIVNRKVRCPKCQMKFVARPEMVRTVSAMKSSDTEKLPSKTSPVRKPSRVAEEIVDDVEILEDDDELPEFPAPKSSRSKRPSKPADDDDDFDDLPMSPKKKKDSKPKKKVKKAPTRSFGAAVVLWTLGGIVGGIVGGGLWWGIAYATGYNVWYLSVLTGTFVGAGVRLGAAQYEGWMPATTAVVIALFAIFLSKFTLNYTVYFDEMPGLGGNAGRAVRMSEEEVLAEYATVIVGEEYRKQGKSVEHPNLDADEFDDYTPKGMLNPELWKEAETRWKALPATEQAAFRQEIDDRALGIDRKSLIFKIASEQVAPEFEKVNKPVHMTPEEFAVAHVDEGYNRDVMQEAEKRFDGLSPEQKNAMIAQIRSEHQTAEKTFAGIAFFIVLIGTILSFLWPGNLICLILACISAWQIGNYDGVTT